MLNYPVIYFLIALGSAGFAFSGTATGSVDTVRALFVIFALAALVTPALPRRMSLRSRSQQLWHDDEEL